MCTKVPSSEKMQSFSVQALTLRQLGKLSSLQVACSWPGLSFSLRCPRALHARQLWGSAPPFAQRSAALLKPRDAAALGLTYQQTRFKGYKRKKGRAGSGEDEDEDEDGEDSEDEDELQEEDLTVPRDYKDQEKNLQSLRFDLVMKTGLDIARHKIEDAFYDNKLRLNEQKLIKKSKSVKVGDTLDLIVAEDKEKDVVTLKRVVLKKIVGETKDGEKLKVLLRTWKHLQLPKRDAVGE